MVIRNSLCYISAIILNHLLIRTSKFLSGWVKSLIVDLYLLTNCKLFLALLIYNIIRSNIYYSSMFFFGLQ